MSILDILTDIRVISEMKEQNIESEYQILLRNAQILNHLHFSDFTAWLISSGEDPKNKKTLELFAKFGANIDLRNHISYVGHVIKIQESEAHRSTQFWLKNDKKLEGADWMWCLPASRIFCRENINMRKAMLVLLLKHGLDVCARSYYGQTILQQFITYFVENGDEDVLEITDILIDSGVPINEHDNTGCTPLDDAIRKENIELVALFIKKGADVNKANSSLTMLPLYSAVLFNNFDLVNLLILNNAKVNAKIRGGLTALHAACERHYEQLIALLIQKNADISAEDKDGDTPFFFLDPENDNYTQCMKIMVKEIAKRNFNGLLVSQVDLNSIQASTESRKYFESCVEELTQMSTTKFYVTYSYNHVLKMRKNINKLASLTKNEEFVASFEKNLTFPPKFPYYENDLRRIFEEAIQARNESEVLISRLYLAFGDFFPEIVIRKLEENLSLHDLPLE